jgi:hypothetical protein
MYWNGKEITGDRWWCATSYIYSMVITADHHLRR